MDDARADLVIQYVLAAAGDRRGSEREVTPTQLVKYAYLADAAHAERHAGATFTGAAWTFSHLGPHAPELEARVAPVARRVGASTRATAYFLDDDDLGHLRAAELALPPVVTGALARALRAFTRDTHALLAHVYATAPMRRALPGAAIDFTPGAPPAPAPPEPAPAPLSARARAALSARRAAPEPAPAPSAPAYAPRYDACFVDGQRALDASERPLVACGGSLTVDPELWSAPARRERDVP